MKKSMFNKLVKSLKQAIDIAQGNSTAEKNSPRDSDENHEDCN